MKLSMSGQEKGDLLIQVTARGDLMGRIDYLEIFTGMGRGPCLYLLRL